MVFTNSLFRILILSIIAAAADAAPFSSRSSNSNIRPIARSSLVESENGTYDGCMYQVEGVGAFNSELNFDFTTMDTLPDELIASTYTVGSGAYAPYAHIFDPDNIILGDGEPLQMMVPGGQTEDPLSTSQMVTAFNDVLYASVRTVAQVSPVNGTVHGFFMYRDDFQETDIEIRTGDPTHVHFTNQQTAYGNGETTYGMDAPSDMSSAFHEYRYDWLPDGTHFYIDGELILTISRNNPSEPGWLMWNNWSNGWEWTMGPPIQDNIVLIKSISAFFNRTSIAASCTASSTSTTAVATGSTLTSANPVTSSSSNVGVSSTVQSATSSNQPVTSSSNNLGVSSSSQASTSTTSNYINSSTSTSTSSFTSQPTTSLSTIPSTSLSTTSSSSKPLTTLSTVVSTPSSTVTSSALPTTSSSTDAITTSSVLSTSTDTSPSTTSSISSTPTPTVSCPTSNHTLYIDPTTSLPFWIECGIDHSGGDLAMVYVSSFADCIAACASNQSCVDVSLSGAACYMKSSVGAVVDSGGVLGARLVDDGGNSTALELEGTETVENATYNVHVLIQLHVDAHLVQVLSAD